LDIEKQKTKLAQFSAIVKTTQMLAHDVRKPFSMLQGILSLLESCHDPDEIVRLSKDVVRDVQRALAAVDGMIEDTMVVGREVKTEKKPICPESLIEASLTEVCWVYQKASVKLHYKWNHRHMINADAMKLQRVFSNIFANAIQAMNNQGALWIKTWEDPSENMTLFCIGNSGSSIAQEDLPQVFDVFYTKNKAGGTGLGLAIAQKIILAHGGRIWCESSEKKKTVESYFTLPTAAAIVNKHTLRLPNNTQKAIAAVGKNRTLQPHTGEHPGPL
jgi:signal transduction histidine kinase